MNRISVLLAVLIVVNLSGAYAGEADVLKVEVRKSEMNSYRFSVTVSHKDTGGGHYADKFDVMGPDGTVFGTRTLHHPHVDEQPFTRSLSGVEIGAGIKSVIVRAHDSVHEYGGKTVTLDLPK